ncbi:MAG: hypothetical protein ABIU05_05830 [Nitrospirales bacterium]
MPYKVQLRAANGLYVCAEGGGGREVVANRAIPKEWERFTLTDPDRYPLESGDHVVLAAHNNMFMCAEGGGGQKVVANRRLAGPWELFTILLANRGTGELTNGAQVGLQASNGQYVCAEGGGGREVVANRGEIGPWETFSLEILGEAPVLASAGPFRLGYPWSHHWVECSAKLSSNGRVDTQTHTWTREFWTGMRSGVGVFFVDAASNTIAALPIRAYGVCAFVDPTCPNDRTDNEVDQLSSDVYQRTAKIEILLKEGPSKDFITQWNRLLSVGKPIVDVIKEWVGAGGRDPAK